MARDERSVTPQSEDFSAWYNDVVFRAELVDRWPVRGSMVIRPYGYRIWELLQADLDGRIKATGHQNAYFPLLIPQSFMEREAEHVEGFAPELFMVTHVGGKELEEPLVIRPTSETVVGEMMAKWISSYRDLPLLLNQWSNVLRWEMRPRMFLRTSEFLWQEGHTAHVNAADATAETMLALGFYQDVAVAAAAMATVPGEKTPRERFAGAERTFTIEAHDARRPRPAGGHLALHGDELRDRVRDHLHRAETGTVEPCHTTSWGMSTRMIGGVVMTHGDDKGLVLPPALAPYQVVIVPIGRGEQAEATSGAGAELAARLGGRVSGRTWMTGPSCLPDSSSMTGRCAACRSGSSWVRGISRPGTALMSRPAELPAGRGQAGDPARCRAGPAGGRAGRVPGDADQAGRGLPRRPHGHRQTPGPSSPRRWPSAGRWL